MFSTAKESKKAKAFSLIEVLVVIFILVLAIGITLASLQDTKPIDEVEAAARNISALIREAQNSSLTGREQLNGSVLENVCDNGVLFANGASFLTVTNNFKRINNSTNPSTCVSTLPHPVEKTSRFKNVSVSFTAYPANGAVNRIFFTTPGGKVGFANGNTELPATTTSVRVLVTSTVNPAVKSTVCVYSSGNVREIVGEAGC